MRYSVGIVDDHNIVRAGFKEMLEGQSDIAIAFDAEDGEQALQKINEIGCNIVLLDISLPGINGIDLLRTLRERHSEIKVLMLSGFPEDRYALAMIRNGASGYLCKDCSQEELLKAIRTVAVGKRYLSAKTAELLAEELTGESEAKPHESLSEREFQVFIKLAEGERVSEIANGLHLSVKTISTYRTRLLEKLAVDSNAELAAYAIRHELIEQ
jgi:DNA-binding NarL/FixJ family response regulator